MKKKIVKIISLVLSILIILISPISLYFTFIDNNAFAAEFVSDMHKQFLIPLLISSGLVFASEEAAEDTAQKLNDWMVDNGYYYQFYEHGPEDPQPDLKTVIMSFVAGKVIWDKLSGGYKKVIEVKDELFDLIKSWVDENFNEGENIEYGNFIVVSTLPAINPIVGGIDAFTESIVYLYDMDMVKVGIISRYSSSEGYFYKLQGYGNTYSYPLRLSKDPDDGIGLCIKKNQSSSYYTHNEAFYISSIDYSVLPELPVIEIYGTPEIVDYSDYDWKNPYTDSKTITIPIETGIEGKPEVDSEGYHIPAVDTEYWLNKEPQEVTQTDPSGIPEPEESDDTQTGILNILKNFILYFQNIASNLTDIKENTDTMTESIGNGGSGDGTDIPTDFEWGDFRRFFDIIFIFIYFIVILILILVKFLQLVFVSLVSIPANTDLFDQYPTILSGVEYLKNLRVGNLSITVHQAFEYIFTVFFFIFIIKQIRKLYDSYVYEENERERSNLKQKGAGVK